MCKSLPFIQLQCIKKVNLPLRLDEGQYEINRAVLVCNFAFTLVSCFFISPGKTISSGICLKLNFKIHINPSEYTHMSNWFFPNSATSCTDISRTAFACWSSALNTITLCTAIASFFFLARHQCRTFNFCYGRIDN